MIPPSTPTLSTLPLRRSTISTRHTRYRIHQLHIDDHRPLSCLRLSPTTPASDCRQLPPPTTLRHRPTSNSTPSLPAPTSHSVLQCRRRHHQPLSRTLPPAKVTIKVMGSPDSAHARLAVQLFPLCSRLRRLHPCRRVCSSRTSLHLNDQQRQQLTSILDPAVLADEKLRWFPPVLECYDTVLYIVVYNSLT